MWTKIGALLALTVLRGLIAQAESISIYPTTILLEPGRNIGALTLHNRSDREAVYELAGYKWTQTNGEDDLTLDKSFIVTPPVVSLAAGESRVVRVGLLAEETGSALEQAYRLRISELPLAAGNRGATLNVRLQVLLPVFTKRTPAGPKLELAAFKSDDGSTCVEGRNLGNTHARLAWITSPDELGAPVPIQKYILANSNGSLCVNTPFGDAEQLTVAVTSAYQNDIRPYEVPVTGR